MGPVNVGCRSISDSTAISSPGRSRSSLDPFETHTHTDARKHTQDYTVFTQSEGGVLKSRDPDIGIDNVLVLFFNLFKLFNTLLDFLYIF